MRLCFSLCLAGDCTGYNIPEMEDPFENFRKKISTADIFLLNLEGVVISQPYMSSPKGLPPNRFLKPLVRKIYGDQPCLYSLPAFAKFSNVCKFNIASIANNHVLDWGRLGIVETKKHLSNNQVLSIGAGLNRSDACKPCIIKINGFKIAFTSYCVVGKVRSLDLEIFSAGLNPIRIIAGYGMEGTASHKGCQMENQIGHLSKQTDFVVVSLHIGSVWEQKMNQQQLAVVERALTAGADIVVCHHSHVPSGILITQDKRLAFLGMGDFIFNYNRVTAESFIAFINVYTDRLETIIHPIKLIRGIPHKPTESAAIKILQKVYTLSKPAKFFKKVDRSGFFSVEKSFL